MKLKPGEIQHMAALIEGAARLQRLLRASGHVEGELCERVADWERRLDFCRLSLGAVYRDSLPFRYEEIEEAVKDLEAATKHYAEGP